MNWTETPEEVRQHWFDHWKPELEYLVRNKFREKAALQFKNTIYDATKRSKPRKWMGQQLYNRIMEKRKAPEFVERSERAKTNKRSGVPEGEKVGPGHRQGTRSTLRLNEEMTKENNNKIPHSADVYFRGHSMKTKDGTQLLPKAAELKKTYEEILESSSQSGTTVAPDEAYFKAVGGRKKGRVLGLGSASDIYYQKSRIRTSSVTSYAPSVISQISSKVEEVTKSMSNS